MKGQLRNLRSFEHVETVRSPVDGKGTFGLIMTYRAENGFGGTNVEAIGAKMNARTCRFERASNASLAIVTSKATVISARAVRAAQFPLPISSR